MTNTSHAIDPHAHSADAPVPHPAPGTWQLFSIWAGIGLQSFGGGASTTLLIQRAFIEKYGWVSSDEFLRLWNLCQLAPGINLIAIAILLGKKLGGTRGILVSVAGMLLPSATITCLLAAFFLHVERVAAVQAALRGVIPATGGIMLVVAYNFARPFIRDARGARLLYTLTISAFVLAGALAIIRFNVSAIVVIPGLAIVGAFLLSPARPSPESSKPLPSDQGDAQ
ncbi:MAG: chromate transporter [Ktedonobacterales bacterium]